MGEADGDRANPIARLCYGGESVVDGVRLDGAIVAVTTHRVLTYAPEGDGPTLQAAPLPNVEGIEAGNAGDEAHAWRGLRYGVYAVVLFGASTVFSFDGMTAVEPPGQTGAGQVVSMAVAMTGILGLVDDLLRLIGVIVLLVALAFAAIYGYSRERLLRVRVAGDDPITLPTATDPSAAADRLALALEKASNPSDG